MLSCSHRPVPTQPAGMVTTIPRAFQAKWGKLNVMLHLLMPVVILHKATMTECMKFKYNDCERECHVNLGILRISLHYFFSKVIVQYTSLTT